MLFYCKKCGRVVSRLPKQLGKPCDYCQSIMESIPEEYLNDSKIFIKEDLEQQFIDEYIKSSPEFDQYLFDHRDEDLARRRMEDSAKLAHGKAIMEEKNSVPKCPTCQSTNIRKIGGVERGASVAMLGLFSKKINKSFKCNNCGYTW